jgi:hypothetical protein
VLDDDDDAVVTDEGCEPSRRGVATAASAAVSSATSGRRASLQQVDRPVVTTTAVKMTTTGITERDDARTRRPHCTQPYNRGTLALATRTTWTHLTTPNALSGARLIDASTPSRNA